MYNYAYGSNLDQAYLNEHCPSAKFVMKAYLPNYEVQFRFWSKRRNAGISTIIPLPGELVHGVIYDISESDITTLDELESVPEGLYQRNTFLLMGEDCKWHKADAYYVTKPEGPFPPSIEYLKTMIKGAKNHEIDPNYIKELEELLIQSKHR